MTTEDHLRRVEAKLDRLTAHVEYLCVVIDMVVDKLDTDPAALDALRQKLATSAASLQAAVNANKPPVPSP